MTSGVARFLLRFPREEIVTWAQRYSYPSEEHVAEVLAPRFRKRGFLTKPEFLDVCRWKTPRTQPRCEWNTEEFISAVTQIALSTPCERLRIEALTLLDGVAWPTASVLLHFGHGEPYPVLDFRALWSLQVEEPKKYDFGFWAAYTRFCRQLAEDGAVSMRDLDRALWQYSKEKQG